MKIKQWKYKILQEFPAGAFFLLGFIIGTILPNFLWKLQWKQETINAFYLLAAFGGREISGKDYFFQVLSTRGSWFLICALCGFSVFGVPISVFTIVGAGIKTGAVLSMSVLQFGFAGGAAGLSLLLPHEAVYTIVLFYFLKRVYGLSMNCWKGRGVFPEGIPRYCLSFLVCGAFYFGGIVLETYVNPWLVEKTVKFLNFF